MCSSFERPNGVRYAVGGFEDTGFPCWSRAIMKKDEEGFLYFANNGKVTTVWVLFGEAAFYSGLHAFFASPVDAGVCVCVCVCVRE